jgi:hypothetical protein
MKRGGDDCSVIFCLNRCTGNGECKEGVCECNPLYLGEDCSIFMIDVNSASYIGSALMAALAVSGALLF